MRLYFVIILLLLAPFGLYAVGTLDNVGFPPTNIWYSEAELREGESVKIYTLVVNAQEETLVGTIEFYDRDVILGKQYFVLEGGKWKEFSVDWNVTVGDHLISAQIVDSKLISDGEEEPIFLTNSTTGQDKIFVPNAAGEDLQLDLKNEVTDKIQKVEDFIEDKVPESLKKKVSSIFTKFDTWREEKANSFQDTIEVKEQAGEETIEIFFLKLLSWIFNNKLLFYGLVIILAFSILRSIWRRLF